MNKRGQVTIFIILGIVILAVFVWLIFMSGLIEVGEFEEKEGQAFVSSQIEPVSNLVKDCAKLGLDYELPILTKYAGYHGFTSYVYYYQGAWLNKLVSISDGEKTNRVRLMSAIKNDLEESVRNFIMECSFEGFEGLELEFGDINVDAFVYDENIDLEINYSITISKGNYSADIEEHLVSYPSNFGKMYKTVLNIVNSESIGVPMDDVDFNNDPANDVEFERTNDVMSGDVLGVVYRVYTGEEMIWFVVDR